MKEKLKNIEYIKKSYYFILNLERKILYYISPVLLTKVLYKKAFNKKLNIKSPQTFNEKIQWLKLYYYNDNKLVKNCIDKYEVRKYVKSKGLENILVKLLGVYDSENDINYESLPKKFVLKSTSGSGNNIIVDDKTSISKEKIIKTLKKWKKDKYEVHYAELQYKGIPKRIICEEYLDSKIIDYKFFCFHGKPKFLYVSSGLGKHENLKMDYLDMDFKSLGISREGYSNNLEIEKPKNFKEMIEIAKKLSIDFPFVRVDLYNLNGKIYFSELTFIPTGGLMKINPKKFDKIWGTYLDLSKIKK